MEVVLIPAYKPDNRLTELVEGLIKDPTIGVLVVDDGSGPEYEDIFGRLAGKAVVIAHEVNLGKGMALRTGLSEVIRHYPECTCVIFADSDGQHPVPDILAIRDKCLKEDAFILTTRIFGKMPFRSRIGNSFIRLMYAVLNHQYYSDNQCGLRAFPVSMTEMMMEVPGDRYEYEMAMLIRAEKTGVRIVPFYREAVYMEDNASSHFRPVADSVRVVGRMSMSELPSIVGAVIRMITMIMIPYSGVKAVIVYAVAGLISGILTTLLYSLIYIQSGYRDAGREICWRVITDIITAAAAFGLSSLTGMHRMAAFLIAVTVFWLVKYRILKLLSAGK